MDRWLVRDRFWPYGKYLGYFIARRKRLQTTANWFILSLAVADFSVTGGYFPASFVCKVKVECNDGIRLNFGNFFMEASMFALMAMIAERYIAIVHSLQYVRVMTKKNIVAMVAPRGEFQLFCLLVDGYRASTTTGFLTEENSYL